MIKTDILIIGAGPAGLFTVFEAGLQQLRCHIIDALPQPGGQLSEVYPKKPIYDIPGYPKILAHELVDKLLEQIAPFKPGFTLGQRAESVEKLKNGNFKIITTDGTVHEAPVIVIASGLGCFEPRKPILDNLERYEGKGVDYMVLNPNKYLQKNIVIAGGGDSALDWAIELSDIGANVTLVHRRTSFRASEHSVNEMIKRADAGKINFIAPAQVNGLLGDNQLEKVVINHKKEGELTQEVDYFLPLFGLSPKLGPIAEWGLNLDRSAIEVNPLDYSTNVEGIFAVGDSNTYPGKLKLILCGFHEAAVMIPSAFKIARPEGRISFKYTTVNGITGF